jgi:anti-sigma-K factor RskA
VNAEQTEEQASLYVLGLLPPDEARSFEAAMAADPELASLVDRLEASAAALAWTAPPIEPPPGLRARIADRIEREGPERSNVIVPFPRISYWLPWAAAACLTVLAGWLAYDRYHLTLLVYGFLNRDRIQQQELDHVQTQRIALQNRLDSALSQIAGDEKANASLEAQMSTLRSQVADLNARNALSQIKIATLASMLKNAPQALAVVAWDPGAQRGIVQTLNMPHARSNQDYQLWIIDPDYKSPVSAGVFEPGKQENFQPLHPISKADKFAVSLEKKGGSSSPLGPIVLMGE